MVGQVDPPPAKTTEEIQQKAEEEMSWSARLASELDKRKGHNSMSDELGVSEDDPWHGAPSWRHHLKFNSRHCANRVQL
jgi:hypothetical protein